MEVADVARLNLEGEEAPNGVTLGVIKLGVTRARRGILLRYLGQVPLMLISI